MWVGGWWDDFVTIGTRYLRRGVDKEGYVANYVETEMVREL